MATLENEQIGLIEKIDGKLKITTQLGRSNSFRAWKYLKKSNFLYIRIFWYIRYCIDRWDFVIQHSVMEISNQLHQVALENVDYQMRKYGMKCGFTEVLSTFVKFLPFLFEQSPKAGSTKDAVCIADLFLSAPCFGSPLEMSGPFFSSPAGTAEQTASLSQTQYPNKLSNLRCWARFKNVLKQILWRFLALWRDLYNRCVRTSAAQNCHLQFDTVHFQLRFSWGGTLVLNWCR